MAIIAKFPRGNRITWQTGGDSSALEEIQSRGHECYELTAKDDELTIILEDSKNLPNVGDQKTLTWCGDSSRFIALNIKNIFRVSEKEPTVSINEETQPAVSNEKDPSIFDLLVKNGLAPVYDGTHRPSIPGHGTFTSEDLRNVADAFDAADKTGSST